MRKTVVTIVGAVLVAGASAACSSGSTSSAPTNLPSLTASSPASSPAPLVSTAFAAPAATGTQPAGITYSPDLVAVGAKATVAVTGKDGGTQVTFTVSGLQPNHMYGAHVHTKTCGAQPADSGPHYQNTKDPVQPSVNPAFANKDNEVWLDLMTDAKGDASVASQVKWTFRKGEANAVVIHADHTLTTQGQAGTAGARLACVTAALG